MRITQIFGKSFFVEPIMDYLGLLGEEDPDEQDARMKKSEDKEKTLWDYVHILLDNIFLKNPRLRDDALDTSKYSISLSSLDSNSNNLSENLEDATSIESKETGKENLNTTDGDGKIEVRLAGEKIKQEDGNDQNTSEILE